MLYGNSILQNIPARNVFKSYTVEELAYSVAPEKETRSTTSYQTFSALF